MAAPGGEWIEAAPVGNGRLGAMVFGGPGRTRLQINDSTVWSGTPHGPADSLADVLATGAGPARLDEVRRAIRAGDYRTADLLLMSFEGPYSQEFLPFADLWLTLGEGSLHTRTLNLDNGVAHEFLTVDGHEVERSVWASHPAGVLCVSITGRTDVKLELDSPLHTVHKLFRSNGFELGVEIPVDGAPQHEPEVKEPLRYAVGALDDYDPFGALVVRIDTDGHVSTTASKLTVTGSTRTLLVLATSTAARDFWDGRAPRTRTEHLNAAAEAASVALAKGAETLLREHDADLRALLGGTSLRIGRQVNGPIAAEDVLSGRDEQLTATVMFQYGRYLLASSSRPGSGPPANLQGVWNDELRPAWSSNYTVNINTQMNYWPAEVTGLAECHLPLIDLLDKLAANGSEVAQHLYGARGWVTHHNTDMWGWALPVGMGHGAPSWAIWQMGGAWLVHHAWDHYEFTGDIDFLRDRAWPLLRGCAEFCLDWLVEGDGWLDTIPSTSPENWFLVDGTPQSLSWSSTMDIALIRSVFTRCLDTARLAGLDDPVLAEIEKALPRLRPIAVAEGGWIQEWVEDVPEEDPKHRHMSPLVSVYPLGQIDSEATPELAEAAVNLMDRRGNGAMGWSWAWKIALRARLGDGETARSLLLEATRPLGFDWDVNAPTDGSQWGGLLPNLFSSHPPFQIDGNYGFPAGIAEMLVQSHNDVIRVLPALPASWPSGALTGVRCRGGVAADITWRDGSLAALSIRRLSGDPLRTVKVAFLGRREEFTLAVGEERRLAC
ncbi:glycosyl hydrolase family 95 catalytic domain-containing protein [Kutzneria chonburiensis]|uniref:glycosyl hydrolase family 95 catalytic domain-containing protein n=1 Tax=Kutzneria chonburiensis TaxID=1483604 RepID=UPI00235FAB20|nr:glycoside hydrolase N-terminal domain-containing protein [Kutzneria chonburiensis]